MVYRNVRFHQLYFPKYFQEIEFLKWYFHQNILLLHPIDLLLLWLLGLCSDEATEWDKGTPPLNCTAGQFIKHSDRASRPCLGMIGDKSAQCAMRAFASVAACYPERLQRCLLVNPPSWAAARV
mgnify:CR=1 FL=1